jgi:hypothetical protein
MHTYTTIHLYDGDTIEVRPDRDDENRVVVRIGNRLTIFVGREQCADMLTGAQHDLDVMNAKAAVA